MSLLTVQGLTVDLAGKRVVDDTAFAIEAGELVGLIGPNGAGKTSLLRALAGLIPCRGRVTLEGEGLADLPTRRRAQRLAYLAQGSGSHWALSAEALVGLGRLPHRSPFRAASDGDGAAVRAILEELELTALAKRSVLTLSGGERARVLLARALVGEPLLLLADEPVAALDPGQQLRVMRQLRQRVERGLAVIIVLHDLSLAVRFCDRLLLLSGGRIRADDRPDAVVGSAAMAESYGLRFAVGTVAEVPSVTAQLR